MKIRLERILRHVPVPALSGLLFLGALQLGPCPAHGHETFILGIHPYQPDKDLREMFAPLADRLTQAMGHSVEIRVGSNYEEHIHATGTGLVDLAFIGPAGYVNLTHLFGEQRILGKIVTNGEPVFRGHIVVLENSPITALEELAGQRLAFVDRYSTMYLVPYAMMKQAGLTQEDLSGLSFLGSHHNVALGVLAGDFVAGAVKEEVFLKFADRGLRSLAPTMEIPEHVFVASDSLDTEHLTAARSVLLELDSTEIGVRILQGIKPSITGVVAAEDADFDQLRALLKFLDEGSE